MLARKCLEERRLVQCGAKVASNRRCRRAGGAGRILAEPPFAKVQRSGQASVAVGWRYAPREMIRPASTSPAATTLSIASKGVETGTKSGSRSRECKVRRWSAQAGDSDTLACE